MKQNMGAGLAVSHFSLFRFIRKKDQPAKEMLMGRTNRPTIKTIAREAGVTANTVSQALRDSKLVTADTKTKIMEIARSQGYVPNVLAESLRSGRSRTVALVFGNLGNPLFAMKTQKMEHLLRQLQYQVLILNSNEDKDQELEVIQTAISRKVDGVVLCPSQKGRAALDLLKKHDVPCVLVGRSFREMQEDAVVWDNETGGYMATSHLIHLGCKRILYICGAKYVTTSWERYDGYVRALREAGLPFDERLIIYPYDTEGGLEAALKAVETPYDGIFAFSDMLLWETACHVPKSMKMVGFDNIQSFFALPISYSSVATDMDEETRNVIDLLLSRIEDPERPTQKVVLPVQLVVR
jgi:LacI family transcriptional regulator